MTIFLLTNPDFLGDNNQLKGIQLAINAKVKDRYEFQQLDESVFKIDELSDDDVVLVSGCHGLTVAETIKQKKTNLTVIWSGHQYFNEFNSLKYWPDIVALPKTALSEKQKEEFKKNTCLVATVGVSHCVNDNTVQEEYDLFKGTLPNHDKFPKQIGIVLAGDAPALDGKMKLFTAADAKKQAAQIAQYLVVNGYDETNTAIMITNGPRTGKYNLETGTPYDPDPHRSGQVDTSSIAFLGVLEQAMKKCQLFFYDFQFEALKSGSSAYKPMINNVSKSQEGLWFVPSESTSMVTESNFFLEKGKSVVIYHPSSENETHLAHATDAQVQGFALDIIGNTETTQIHQQEKSVSASTQIAEAFYVEVVLNRVKVSSSACTMYRNPSNEYKISAEASLEEINAEDKTHNIQR